MQVGSIQIKLIRLCLICAKNSYIDQHIFLKLKSKIYEYEIVFVSKCYCVQALFSQIIIQTLEKLIAEKIFTWC